MRIEKLYAAIVTAVMLAAPVVHAAPASFPEKPIRLVIGTAPGTGADIIARAIADRLYGAWGHRIVVDSRPGVAGILSAELVLRTNPDGYTWMLLTSQHIVGTAVHSNVKFNIEKDFAAISLVGTVPFVLVVNPEVPAKSVRELIDAAKRMPLKYGSGGTGASEHLSGVLLTRLTGTDMLHVPYKGVAAALSAMMGKEVDLTYGVVPAVLGAIQAGRVRALGVTSLKRNALLPDVPSIAEEIPGYEILGWYGLVAPTGTPEAVLAKASAEVIKAVKAPQFGEQLKGLGLEIVAGSRSDLDAFRRNQRKQMTELVKAAGVDVK